MELTSTVDPTARFHIAAPLFFNDEIIGVLDGKYVQDSVARTALTGYRIEQRTSFKHPIMGLILGIALIVAPVQSFAGDPLRLWWFTMGSLHGIAGSFFMLLCGLYLVCAVIRRRDEPWIVLLTTTGERAFRLRDGLTPQAVGVLTSLVGDPADAPHC